VTKGKEHQTDFVEDIGIGDVEVVPDLVHTPDILVKLHTPYA
jgi:hypothetical protein